MIAPLSRGRAALLVVDIQERLVRAMTDEVTGQVLRNAAVLIEAAKRLGLPIVVTQQYPKGLGATVPAVADALAGASGVHRVDKLEFSAVACGEVAQLVPRLGRDQWIVCGMETHVCVYQTVRGLVARGHAVHVASDAACSRTKANWRIGLSLCERAGAVVSSTEACVFDLLECAGSDEFRALSRIIK